MSKENGMISVGGSLVRLTKDLIYFPAADGNAKHARAITTGIVNKRDGKDGKKKTVHATLKFWGALASVACCHLKSGRQILIQGELDTYDEKTGQVDAAGKDIYKNTVEIRVNHFEFAGATKKEVRATIRANWPALIALGLMHPSTECSDALLDKMLETKASPTVNYDPAQALASGKYGYARVMVNKQFVGPQNAGAVAAGAIPAINDVEAAKAELKKLQDRIAAWEKAPSPEAIAAKSAETVMLEQGAQVGAADGGVVDPFAGAAQA